MSFFITLLSSSEFYNTELSKNQENFTNETNICFSFFLQSVIRRLVAKKKEESSREKSTV